MDKNDTSKPGPEFKHIEELTLLQKKHPMNHLPEDSEAIKAEAEKLFEELYDPGKTKDNQSKIFNTIIGVSGTGASLLRKIEAKSQKIEEFDLKLSALKSTHKKLIRKLNKGKRVRIGLITEALDPRKINIKIESFSKKYTKLKKRLEKLEKEKRKLSYQLRVKKRSLRKSCRSASYGMYSGFREDSLDFLIERGVEIQGKTFIKVTMALEFPEIMKLWMKQLDTESLQDHINYLKYSLANHNLEAREEKRKEKWLGHLEKMFKRSKGLLDYRLLKREIEEERTKEQVQIKALQIQTKALREEQLKLYEEFLKDDEGSGAARQLEELYEKFVGLRNQAVEVYNNLMEKKIDEEKTCLIVDHLRTLRLDLAIRERLEYGKIHKLRSTIEDFYYEKIKGLQGDPSLETTLKRVKEQVKKINPEGLTEAKLLTEEQNKKLAEVRVDNKLDMIFETTGVGEVGDDVVLTEKVIEEKIGLLKEMNLLSRPFVIPGEGDDGVGRKVQEIRNEIKRLQVMGEKELRAYGASDRFAQIISI